MKRALDGLEGIINVEMDLGKDAFTIFYDPSQLSVSAITARIRKLGYRPEEALKETLEGRVEGKPSRHIPEPVASALAEAIKSERLLFIDFYAAWCGPCKEIEAKVFPDPEVRKTMERYHFLKVDTDEYVEPSKRFQVFVLPTLLVLHSDGIEIYRHVGMIDPKTLVKELSQLTETSARE